MSESGICCLNAARASPVSCCCAASVSHLGRNSFSRSSADRLGLARARSARREALDLFPLVPLHPQLGCTKCLDVGMGRGDLSDAEREWPRPFLPVSNRRCGRWGVITGR
ncbi:hypothetical protein Slala05_82200 [Streptomyces lavendulae subsp. lavendulae]|nr:hypothetical protein Slala05_82200 [Streptomyces lavendulae subsp. lavendulae]